MAALRGQGCDALQAVTFSAGDGDGAVDRMTTVPQLTWHYTGPGTVTVTVTATDEHGAPGSDSGSITVVGAACTITGTNGLDTLSGGLGDDVVCGLGGGDTLKGGHGDDVLAGGGGRDDLNGVGHGDDTLRGSLGPDDLQDGYGNDLLDARDRTQDGLSDCGASTDAGHDPTDPHENCETLR